VTEGSQKGALFNTAEEERVSKGGICDYMRGREGGDKKGIALVVDGHP